MRKLFFLFLLFCFSSVFCYDIEQTWHCSKNGSIKATIVGRNSNIMCTYYPRSGGDPFTNTLLKDSWINEGKELVFWISVDSYSACRVWNSESVYNEEGAYLYSREIEATYSYTPCNKQECSVHGAWCGDHDDGTIDHNKCDVCVGEGGYGKYDCVSDFCPVHRISFCKTHQFHFYGTKTHGGYTHEQCFNNENELNSFLNEYYCDYCKEFICDICRPEYHKGCNICYNEYAEAKGTADCIKATCSVHNVLYCTAKGHEKRRSHWEGTLSHGNGVSHTKCFETESKCLEFETPDYCDYCGEFKCDICRPDYHDLCGVCVGIKKGNGYGKGKAGCVEAVCPIHKERYCSGHNTPEHWIGTLTHVGVNGGSITHTDCLANEAKRDDFQTGNICDYCGEIDCSICHAFDHSKCNKCINQGGAGLLDCTRATCSVHNKEYCATHNPTHWVETLNCGFAKHTRCFKSQEEALNFLKVDTCKFCNKIICPICGGHDKCQECMNGNPCTPVCPQSPPCQKSGAQNFGSCFFAFECVRTDFSSLTGRDEGFPLKSLRGAFAWLYRDISAWVEEPSFEGAKSRSVMLAWY